MFSEYASRMLNQSQLRLSRHQANSAAPLFERRFDEHEDIRESLALRQSRGGRFGAFLPVESDDEEGDEEDYDADHHAMQSSWKPPPRSPTLDARSARKPEAIGEESMDEVGLSDDDAESDHSAAPDDIMFGVPLDQSHRPRGPQLPDSVLHESTNEPPLYDAQPQESKIPEVIGEVPVVSARHDRAYAVLYTLSLAVLSATSLFLWLTTDAPRSMVYDSVYGVLAHGLPRIGRDLVIALAIAAVWFWLLCKCVGPLTYATVVGPPLFGFAFGTYTLVGSFHDAVGATQIRAMRWTSALMYIAVGLWTLTAWRRRKATGRAVSVISLACTVLDRNPQLVLVTIGLLASFLAFSTIWLWNFERIFLRGKLVTTGRTTEWLVKGDSWPLGAFYCIVYLWTYGVMSGVQRATASAVVSHWYFHRHELPALTPRQVTSAALSNATSTNFGSSCMSSLLVLLTRLPLLVLPRRLSTAVSLIGHLFFSAPIYNLCNPLTLSLAAVHAMDLRGAAREADRLHLLDPKGPWQTYRTAKMFLTAARVTTAAALGTTAWVASSRGSLYGYVVALASATVGWAVVGAVEGCASTVVDAAFVCHAIDLRETREGRTHCQEAARAFGTDVDNSLE